uniref:Uncharacterized protein n=1 Tax=Octopus bimaculoides TaxID=37653 RepID=A0A0L8FW71_OCTBM
MLAVPSTLIYFFNIYFTSNCCYLTLAYYQTSVQCISVKLTVVFLLATSRVLTCCLRPAFCITMCL